MLWVIAHQLGHTFGDGAAPPAPTDEAVGHAFGRRATNFHPYLVALLAILGVTLAR